MTAAERRSAESEAGIASHYCGQVQPHAAHTWETPPIYGSATLVSQYQCAGLAAQVPDDGFCTTHPAVGREFCGCPAQVPDISARTICSNCEADLTVHCSSCGAIQ